MDIRIDDATQNAIYKLSEDYATNTRYKQIQLYLNLLETEHLNPDVRKRIRKQLNKEVISLLLFEEEYDQWFKENM
ncbi:MAG: hypothetical protein BZ136_03790 [Methanosphaera sp. rholeuAM74]|nr:MAG: hypothetical protein BZ136_03790 [Methanosphaera sp. rholeuAM74]